MISFRRLLAALGAVALLVALPAAAHAITSPSRSAGDPTVLGRGGYMWVQNATDKKILVTVKDAYCMYDKDEGSGLNKFAGQVLLPGQRFPDNDDGQYIEQRNSTDCFGRPSHFILDFKVIPGNVDIGEVKFKGTSFDWSVDSNSDSDKIAPYATSGTIKTVVTGT